MSVRALSDRCKFPLTLYLLLFVTTLMLSPTARGQDLELHGGWAHVTGDFGTNGFNAGAAWWFTKHVTIAADYDSAWNSSTLSTFTFTSVGAFAVKSHIQDALFGPRIFFSTDWTARHKLNPFGEAQFGFSHLYQKVTQVNVPTVSASDTSFAWMLGGGAEYLLTPHWSARGNLDFLRTHFASEGQSRLRLIIGITYTFGSREMEVAAEHRHHATPVAAGPGGEATVHITSSPSGGEIYIDGRFVGNTPSDFKLHAGEHAIRVLAGGKEWARTVQITPGDIRIDAEVVAP
jgi:opacity protein-like surface antigen